MKQATHDGRVGFSILKVETNGCHDGEQSSRYRKPGNCQAVEHGLRALGDWTALNPAYPCTMSPEHSYPNTH